MARTAEEAAVEYRQALDDLKDNNKMQINLMTILADDYNSYSKEIIDVIAQQIEKVIPSQKLAVMYVMDSILKNVTGAGNYKEYIEKIAHRVFVHTFEMGDERTRLSLHKLRQTWTGIFQKHTLYKIDLAVHAIDPAWPVVTPQPSHMSTRSNNATLLQHKAAPKVHVNPHFLQKSSSSSSENENQQMLPISGKRSNLDPRLAKYENRSTITSKTNADISNSNGITSKDVSVVIKTEPIQPRGDVDERQFLLRQADEKLEFQRTFPLRRNKALESSGRSPTEFNGYKRKTDLSNDIEEKKARIVRSPPRYDKGSLPINSTTVIRPTNDLGSHAFITTQIPAASQNLVANPGLPMYPSTSTAFVAGSVHPVAVPVPVPVPVPVTAVPVFVSSGIEPVNASRGFPVASTVVPTVTPPIISSDTPRLEGIPANNRIFVDGRAYEVSYINDVPVIERNSLPHRIYFTGAPRNVIIDGVAHLMSFGEEKKVIIDGEEHVLRFGAPSRELYMGNYPFKGAFGGPPIFATINGVRHEIRLGGPPPEVKIEPDPCYELLRHMPRAGLNSSRNSAPNLSAQNGSEQQSTLDVKGLLAKLQKSGILSAISNNRKETTDNDLSHRSITPPIPSEHRGVTERLPKPPSDLKDFSMRALKIRYDSVVANLHKERNLCPNCGLKFDDLTSEAYKNHLDWHFRENIKFVAKFKSRCRPWYLEQELWSEREIREVTASTSVPDRTEIEDSTKETNVPCDAVVSKECGVCQEKFDEYWDEEDDAWKLKDCTVGTDGRGFHPACILDDTTVLQSRSEDSPSEDEHCDVSLLKFAGGKLKNNLSLAFH